MDINERRKLFIEKADSVHNFQYNYDNVDYVNATTKVEIICKVHGSFFQRPTLHVTRKQGCPKCGIEKNRISRIKPFSQFVKQATKIHQGFYDYSLSQEKYSGAFKKIPIICPEHGIFYQTPDNHVNDGKGCYYCGVERNRRKFTMSLKEFIGRAVELHGDKYDYSKTKYKNDRIKVIIICKTHGSWKQYPGSHLRGFGCQKCGFDSTAQKNGMTKEDFIKKAENTHGVGTYDYSKVEFINSKTKVIITCLKHGDFGQQPTAHMISCGCPKCYSSSGERRIRLYLEKHNLDFIEQMKFEDCKFELPLLFDFYLPDYNLLIEFDGRQHFEPVDYFGGKEELLKTQKRDMIKNEFAVRQKIKLLRISYKDKKDIEKILKINNLP